MDADDAHHAECLDLLETHPGPLVVPELVITEVTYLLGTRIGVDAEVRFLGDIAAGNLIPEPVAASDWLRIAELVAKTATFRWALSTRPSSRSPSGSRCAKWPLSIAVTSRSCDQPSDHSSSGHEIAGMPDSSPGASSRVTEHNVGRASAAPPSIGEPALGIATPRPASTP